MATKQQQKDFISKIAPLMVKEAKKRGYKIVSTAIAQACIESAWGLSGLAKFHNYFGLKCGSKWTGRSVNMKTKEEYTPGTLTTIRDNFRAYGSMEEGVRGYYDFISASRYANLKTATTPLQYAQRLKEDGYATSSSYANTLISTVSKWDLGNYDSLMNGAAIVRTEPDDKPEGVYHKPSGNIKEGSRGEGVKWLQTMLNVKGYFLKVDGIAGARTIAAVKDFQKKSGLVADGIAGRKTIAALL